MKKKKNESPAERYGNRIRLLRYQIKKCKDSLEIKFTWKLMSLLSPKVRELNRLKADLRRMYYQD